MMRQAPKKKLIAFMGGPCTGKTTLAKAMLKVLKAHGVKAGWSREFVTEDIKVHGPPPREFTIYEQYRFFFNQLKLEEEVLEKSEVLVTDSPIMMGCVYPLMELDVSLSGRQQAFAEEFVSLFKEFSQRYHRIYFLGRDFPFEDNGIRFHSETESKAVDGKIINMLRAFAVPYKELHGSVEERVMEVLKDLKQEGLILKDYELLETPDLFQIENLIDIASLQKS